MKKMRKTLVKQRPRSKLGLDEPSTKSVPHQSPVGSAWRRSTLSTRLDASNPLFVLDDIRDLRSGSLEFEEHVRTVEDERGFKSEGYRGKRFNAEPEEIHRIGSVDGPGKFAKKSALPSKTAFLSAPAYGAELDIGSAYDIGASKGGRSYKKSGFSKKEPKALPKSPSTTPTGKSSNPPPPPPPPIPPPWKANSKATSPPSPPPPPPISTTSRRHPSNVPPAELLAEIRNVKPQPFSKPRVTRHSSTEASMEKDILYSDIGSRPFKDYSVSNRLYQDITYADASDVPEWDASSYEVLVPPEPDPDAAEDNISFAGLSAPPEILARGPRARRAYAEAAQAGTKKVFRTRLMLVGQERVGKTSLKKTLTGQGFDKNEAITDGVETSNGCEISIEVAKAGGKMWSIHKKGNEHEGNKDGEYSKALADEIAKRLILSPEHSQEEASAEAHRDTTDGRGFNPEEADDFLAAEVLEPAAPEEKDDNMPNQIASLVEKMLKEQVRMKEEGTDCTDDGKQGDVSLSIWDFAGHDIYYTTHQVFLTWRAIYVIVFDLSRNLDLPVPPEARDESYEMAKGGSKSELTCLEFINFWLCSIYAHAVAPLSIRSKKTCKTAQRSPPIFIVGTHRESVKGNPKEKKKQIDAAFEKIRKTIKKKPFECHVVPKFFAIENSLEDKDQEIIALREHIEKVATDEPYMGEEIPLRWLLFEEALAADKINYMSLEQAKELTRSVGIETERELVTMLTFYHDLGYIVYYGDMADHQSLLRDIVILNPQWLIDVFKQVITILDPDERDGKVNDAWSKLEEDGILEDRLIHHMWQGFLEQKEALVELMAKFDLICEAPAGRLLQEPETGGDLEASDEMETPRKCYYVPSRLTPRCSADEMREIKSPQDFYVDFKGFLPDGLFHRLMTRAVKWAIERDGEPAILFYRQISLMADDEHQALLEMLPPQHATIKVSVFRAAFADLDEGENKDHHMPPEPKAVREVMDFVVETLDSIRQHWAKQIQYDVCFLCPKCRKRKLFQDCFKKQSLQCGIHRIKTADVKAKFGIIDDGGGSGSESPSVSRRSTCKESKVLCDLYFATLAEQIGSEWHRLALRLELNQADIDHVTEDNLTAVDRILAVLQLWKSRSSCVDRRKMVEGLCKALTSCGRKDLAGEIREEAGISYE